MPLERYHLSPRLLDIFLRAESTMTPRGDPKSTALHWAARLGLHRHTKRLLKSKKYNINSLDSEEMTPFFLAAMRIASSGHLKILDVIIETCPDSISQSGPTGNGVLLYATHAPSSVEVISYFIRKGAHLNATNNNCRTVLHFAGE